MSNSSQERKAIWDALERRIFELVYEVTLQNVDETVDELSKLDMIRGMGLFCKACITRQIENSENAESMASLAAAVNMQFPYVGRLLCRRVVLLFNTALRKNIKLLLVAAAKYIACLVNLSVIHDNILQTMVTKLIQEPIDGSFQVIVHLLKECEFWFVRYSSDEYVPGVFKYLRKALVDEDVEEKEKCIVKNFLKSRMLMINGEDVFLSRKTKINVEKMVVVDLAEQISYSFGVEQESIDAENELDALEIHPLFQEDNYKVKLDWDTAYGMKA